MLRSLIVFFLLIALNTQVQAIEPKQTIESHELIHDLSSDWLVYEQSRNQFLPYIIDRDDNRKNLYIFLYPNQFRNKWLQLSYDHDIGLFLGGKLGATYKGSGTMLLNIDSLFSEYPVDTLLLSIHTEEGIGHLATAVVILGNRMENQSLETETYEMAENIRPAVWDFFKIAAWVILVILTVAYNIDRRSFYAYFNILRTFGRYSNDEFLAPSHKMSRIDLLFIILIAILMGFVVLNVLYALDEGNSWLHYQSIGKSFLSWAILWVLLTAWIFFRLIVVNLMSGIFNMAEIRAIHMYEYLRVTGFYGISSFLLILFMRYVIGVEWANFESIIINSLIIISILRMLILFYKTFNSGEHKNLLIIAYICTAELIPMVIGLNLVLKSALIYFIV